MSAFFYFFFFSWANIFSTGHAFTISLLFRPAAARLSDTAPRKSSARSVRIGINTHFYAGLHAFANIFILEVASLGERVYF